MIKHLIKISFKYWWFFLLIGLVLTLSGCSPQLNGQTKEVVVKRFEVGGENVFVGGTELELGSKEKKFKPEIKLEKWGDETYIRVWSDEEGDAKAKQVRDKIVWKNKDKSKEYNFYSLEPNEQMENGGFEYEVILKKKPKTNIIELNIELKDLECYYQPELTQEEIEEGAFRPENIVGSYACYHISKKNNEYKTGKAFHIFRPQMKDANGWKVWGDLEIKDGKYKVTIPQDFIDKAKYPIKHATGATIGNTSAGASSYQIFNEESMGYEGTVGGSNISLTKITAYVEETDADDVFKGLVYDGDCDITNSLSIVTNAVGAEADMPSSKGWVDSTFSSSPTLTAGNTYQFSIINPGDGYIYYDSGTGYLEQGDDTYNSPSGINAYDFVCGDNSFDFSIYATYSESGGGEEELQYIKQGIINFN